MNYCNVIFKNHRIRGNKVYQELGLSKFGVNTYGERVLHAYNFKLENFKLSNKAVVKIDQDYACGLTYIDNKKLVLFSEKDSVILKLKGQNLEKWLQWS